MNVKEIYENALALSISRMEDEDDMGFYAVKMFNILLSETKIYNDQLRIKKGKEPMKEQIILTDIEGEIDYEDELYAAMSYGLAAKLLAAQEDSNLASLYNNQYVTMLAVTSPAVEVEVD